MTETRHLHRDYGTTHCGLDASFILMTFIPAETDCQACTDGLAEFHAQEAAAVEEAERVAAEQAAAATAEAEAEKARMDELERQRFEAMEAMEARLQAIEQALGLQAGGDV